MKSSLYLPALNSCFVTGIQDEYLKRRNRWLQHYKTNQFDVFKDDCVVHCKDCLLSAGHEPYKRVEVQYEQLKVRDKTKTMLMGDSGGYQIATDKLKIDWNDKDNVDDVRLGILRFLEHNTNISATLDVPTFTIGHPEFKFNTFEQCLNQTVENMEFWMQHRVPDKIRLLNVIQGRNEPEVQLWYDTVKDYTTEGWCFSSANSDSMYHIIRTLLILAKDNQLVQAKNWVHILGRTMPAISVLLTELQNRISACIGNDFQISYDSSSFVQAAITGSAMQYGLDSDLTLRISKADLSFETCKNKTLTLSEYLNSPSKLGESIYLKDMYIWDTKKEKWYWDVPTYAQVMAYNYEISKLNMELAHQKYYNDEINASISYIKHTIFPDVFSQNTFQEMIYRLEKYKQYLLNNIIKYEEPAVLANELFEW
jgi:hypothetical protein